MRVREIMTANPVTCSTETKLAEVARLMIEHDCGQIPLHERGTRRLVGVITDRDIVCRAVAAGKDVSGIKAGQVMSQPAISIGPDEDLEKAVELMGRKRIRRLPVTDANGACIGMLSQADLVRVPASAGPAEESSPRPDAPCLA